MCDLRIHKWTINLIARRTPTPRKQSAKGKGSKLIANPAGPRTPLGNKGFITGLTMGNQWLISPDHKADFF